MDELTRKSVIHLTVTQRNSRKYVTNIDGLKDVDLRKLLSFLKKRYSCNGNIDGSVISLQGDWRTELEKFLVEEKLCDEVVVHGF